MSVSGQPRTRLEAVLQRQGKTVGRLAAETRYSYKHCWHVASGRAQGSLDFYRACAQVLAVPLDDLIEDCAEVA